MARFVILCKFQSKFIHKMYVHEFSEIKNIIKQNILFIFVKVHLNESINSFNKYIRNDTQIEK